jgi:M6 family metalloprotease-like protein
MNKLVIGGVVAGLTLAIGSLYPAWASGSIGSWNIAVLMVDFSDHIGNANRADVNAELFGDHPPNAPYGSLRDYYAEVSYGRLMVSGQVNHGVTNWYRMPQPYSYYLTNIGQLLPDAVQVARTAGYNFGPMDADNDGYVDAIFLIHSGTGQEFSGCGCDIWSFASANPTVDTGATNGLGNPVLTGRYSVVPEWYGSVGNMTIGVFAHEFGHNLGLPDFYDQDGSSKGLGVWSLMAAGTWRGAYGSRPTHLDAWSKVALGWANPVAPTSATRLVLPPIAENPSIYKLYATTREYFLLENRQKMGFDASLPEPGLLIYHVDDFVQTGNRQEWYPGCTTCASHYQVALVPADNFWDLERNANDGDRGDPYPGTSNNTAFTDTSSPSSAPYLSTASGISVTSIQVLSDSTIEADLAAPPLPYVLTVTKASTGSGTVTSIPAGIACGATCSAVYASGTEVALTAAPASGSTFADWSGACTGTGTCLVMMAAAQTVFATFQPLPTYTLLVTTAGSGQGTVASSPAGIFCGATCSTAYVSGTVVTLTATPASGASFGGWSGACTGTGACMVTLTAAQAVTATFNSGTAPTSSLINISSRARVETGANVQIGGFIIGGVTSKTVLLRARGPSLGSAPFNNPGVLANPSMQLYSGSTVIAQNDNWQTTDPRCGSPATMCGNAAHITATGNDPCRPNPGQTAAPPNCTLESALLVTLPPGGYTAIVSGVSGTTGVGLVEVFEADTVTTSSRLINISSRARVETGANVQIGGFIIGGVTSKTVLLRARGPSLGSAPFNNPGVLANPSMQLYSGSTVIAQNDNWQTTDPRCGSPATMCGNAAHITATGNDPCRPNPGQTAAPPNCTLESALLVTLPPGGYTAIVSGVSGTTGVGLVEVFEVP